MLRCTHAELEADHTQALSAHAAVEEQLFSLKDLQCCHNSLEVQPHPCLVKTKCAASMLPSDEYVHRMASLASLSPGSLLLKAVHSIQWS